MAPSDAPDPKTAQARPCGEPAAWRSWWTPLPFLLFCWLSYALFVAMGWGFYYLTGPRLQQLGPAANYAALAIIGFALFILGSGLTLITITTLTGLDLLYPHNRRSVTVTVLFPVATLLAQLLGISRNKLRTSFVKVNNAMTIAQRRRFRADRILVLLPHCLQIDVCNRKITSDIHNCVRCGRCSVARLLDMGERNGLKLEVVNGGTLARRKVATFKPDGIVAVACERDLTFGIMDVYPIPVYGVINDRPYGPCFNTDVDMGLVEEAVRFFKGSPQTGRKGAKAVAGEPTMAG